MDAPLVLSPGRLAVGAWPMTNSHVFSYALSDTLRDLNVKHLTWAMHLGLVATSTLGFWLSAGQLLLLESRWEWSFGLSWCFS